MTQEAEGPNVAAPPPEEGVTYSPGSLGPIHQPKRREDLLEIPLAELSAELLARLASGQTYRGTQELLLGEQLAQALAASLDDHLNRYSARRHRDLIGPILNRLTREHLHGATIVDVGCGSVNPLAFSFLLLMLGAERAHAVDLEPIQDVGMAVRALATVAGWLLLDSRRIVDRPIAPQEVLANLHGFQLPLLAAGDPAGIAGGRLQHRAESLYELSIGDGEADAVFSVSLFEHLDRVDDALESMRRITRPGGIGCHVIDFADHRIYTGDVDSPFEFLKLESAEPLMFGSNRIRVGEFLALFERHGFDVEHVARWQPSALLDDAQRAQFVEPYRSTGLDDLNTIGARVFVRRA